MTRTSGDSLTSCPGSLSIVPLPVPGEQLELVPVDAAMDLEDAEALALF